MIAVLILAAGLFLVAGLVLGSVIAYRLPRPVLYAFWALVAGGGLIAWMMARQGAEATASVEANVILFVVVGPALVGAVRGGFLGLRRRRRS